MLSAPLFNMELGIKYNLHPSPDLSRIITKVMAEHRVRLDPDDPALMFLTMQELMAQHLVEQVLEAVRVGQNEVVAGWDQSARKAQEMAATTLPQSSQVAAEILALAAARGAAAFDDAAERVAHRLGLATRAASERVEAASGAAGSHLARERDKGKVMMMGMMGLLAANILTVAVVAHEVGRVLPFISGR